MSETSIYFPSAVIIYKLPKVSHNQMSYHLTYVTEASVPQYTKTP